MNSSNLLAFSFQLSTLLALISFAFISSITPGPNNLMLLHSGIRFGFQRTIPHMIGICVGFGSIVILCCLGIASIIWKIPYTQTVLKIAGFLYLLWLTFLIWKHGATPDAETLKAQDPKTLHAKPFNFIQATLFQYVNPKAWIMALTIPAAYLPAQGSLIVNTMVISIVFLIINLFSTIVWAQGGVMIGRLTDQPTLRRYINLGIVLLTLYSAIAIWL